MNDGDRPWKLTSHKLTNSIRTNRLIGLKLEDADRRETKPFARDLTL